MTTPLTLRFVDVPVIVSGLPARPRARLADLLAPFAVRPAAANPEPAAVRLRVAPWAEGAGWAVTSDDGTERAFGDEELLLRHVEWLAASRAMAASANCAVFHGAALARGPDVVLLLAKSGAGKTTLTLGLMARGWEPLTDDIVAVDRETLGVHAFPRCFHLDDAVRARVADDVPLAWPGGLAGYARPARWAAGGRAPSAIVLVRRCATCPSSRSAVLRAEAAGALLDQAVANALAPAEVARVAARLAAAARGCYRLTNGHLDGALNLIEGAAAADPPR